MVATESQDMLNRRFISDFARLWDFPTPSERCHESGVARTSFRTSDATTPRGRP